MSFSVENSKSETTKTEGLKMNIRPDFLLEELTTLTPRLGWTTIGFAIAGGLLVFGLLLYGELTKNERCIGTGFLTLIVMLMTTAVIILPEANPKVRYASIPERAFLESTNGQMLVKFPHQFLMPKERWDEYQHQGAELVSYAEQPLTVKMGVSPITENPKVQRIDYRVEVVQLGSLGALVDFRSNVLHNPKFGDAQRLVEYWCFEWQFKHSKEIAEFYNPVNSEQQRRFQTLLRAFVEPKLAGTGVAFAGASFSVQ